MRSLPLPRFWKIYRHVLEHPGPGPILRAYFKLDTRDRARSAPRRLSSKEEILAFAFFAGGRGAEA